MKQGCFAFLLLMMSFSAFAEKSLEVRSEQLVSVGDETYNFGDVNVGSAEVAIFTLINNGVSDIAFDDVFVATDDDSSAFQFLGNSYPGTSGTCGSGLGSGQSCTLVVAFKPTVAGLATGMVAVLYNDLLSPESLTIYLEGNGVSGGGDAFLTISETDPYDFGLVGIGDGAEHTFVVTNSGTATATSMSGGGLAAPFSFKGGSFPGTGGTCGTVLPMGSSCTIVVVFSPAMSGVSSDTIEVNYDSGMTATRQVQGAGGVPAMLSISDGPIYDYGTHATGSTTDHTFTVTNSGSMSAYSMSGSGIAEPFSYKGGSFPGTGGTCGATLLASAASCTIVVTYSPTSTGSHNDTIEINYSGAYTASRSVTGTGTAPAVLTISSGPTYDFGSVSAGFDTTHAFTVTNVGGVSATSMNEIGLASPFGFTGGTYPGVGGTCSTTLAAAASCTIVVQFGPLSVGAFSGTISITYNNGTSAQSVNRPVQGTGTP